MPSVVIIGGPSGTGKSTIANRLTERFSNNRVCFIEGDELHSVENIQKMSNNIPLNDEDRWPWLLKISTYANEQISEGYELIVVTCSMLKKSYRDFLKEHINCNELSLIILFNDYNTILKHMVARKGHFFKETMLKSQFDCLELPKDEIDVSVIQCGSHSPDEIVDDIISVSSLCIFKSNI